MYFHHFLYSKINQRMIDFSLRHLNFPLNELHKRQQVLYLFKGRVHLPKNIYREETPTDTQERFYFACN